jgi:hypothetical protein
MTPQDKKKLEKLANLLREAQTLLRDLLGESEGRQNTPGSVRGGFDAVACLTQLRTLDRAAAEALLADLKQHELGAVFVQSGGPQADRKKPKAWLVEQILWRVFDFERGHESIRRKGEN